MKFPKTYPCPTCQQPATYLRHEETLLAYYSPPGHDHDDNCTHADYLCVAGHRHLIRFRNKCFAPGCDWKGKETCPCHKGPKIEI